MNTKHILHLLTATIILTFSFTFTSCYDDTDLKNRIEDVEGRVTSLEEQIAEINTDISNLRQLISSLSNGAVITAVDQTDEGYRITFSDGRTLELRNGTDGKDGKDGKDAPVIGVAEETGVYYWTITIDGHTVWLTDAAGNKLPVTGPKGDKGDTGEPGTPGQAGDNGTDGRTPVIGVKDGYWTVDYGDGPEFILDQDGNKIPVSAQQGGSMAGGLFRSVVPGEDEIVFTLLNGETFSVPRIDNFGLAIDTSDPIFRPGQTREYPMTLTGVSDIYVTKTTDGWKAAVDGSTLTVSAPESATSGDTADIRIIVVNKRHDVRAFKISVEVLDIRILTFEDEDYRGNGNMLGKLDWSSLIDTPEYGGPLLYPNSDVRIYNWYDQNNTELASQFCEGYGDGNFWNGGIAISNYASRDLSIGDFNHQLSVYFQHSNGNGGHDGSKNFGVQNGYRDTNPDGYASERELPRLYFKDGKARTIRSMWICATLYFANVWLNGNGLSPAAKEGDIFKIVAYAYDEAGNEIPQHPYIIIGSGSTIADSWKKWDLSSLGKVSAITFNLECNIENSYGMSQPAYFAFDDIEVIF